MAKAAAPLGETTDSTRPWVPRAVLAIAAATIVAIAWRVIRYGYLPVLDDPVADAAKAISNRPWTDILVLKDYYALDPHAGWHGLLRLIYLATSCSETTLVLAAVAGLFIAVGWSALPWLRRPESWLASIVIVLGAGTVLMNRLMLGRPFLVSATSLVTVLGLWQSHGSAGERPARRDWIVMIVAVSLSVLLHGSWYLWVMPIVAFVLAGDEEWAKAVALSCVIGTVIGALLTFHPIGQLIESVRMGYDAFSEHLTQKTLVGEFRPTTGNVFGLLLFGGVVVSRRLRDAADRPLHRNPVFWVAALGWVFGYKASRFWEDWGVPAAMLLIAVEVEAILESRQARESMQRVTLAIGLAVAAFLSTTNDVDSRWTSNLATTYLKADDPKLAGWLPDAGGVFYSADMPFFYQTFYANPDAQWKYVTGFEPAMMPDDDFHVYQTILWNNGAPEAYADWIAKMRPQDRVAIRWNASPSIPGLEWKYAAGVWIGRRPDAVGR